MQKRFRRVAANEVIAGDEILSQCIVEISSAVVTDYYQFFEESPQTEWLGGTIVLRHDDEGCLRAYKNENLIE